MRKVITDFEITIQRVVEANKVINKIAASQKYKDKFFFVNIKERGNTKIQFIVPIVRDYGKGLRRVFKNIQKELYLTH